MSTPAPLVSVVMAAYNGAAFIAETIDSVLAQTMPDFEIVVADDGSTDGTRQMLAAMPDPRVRVVHTARNGGPAVARSVAMTHARGRFIVGLDQDDICRPHRFARQLAYLDAHPDVVLVASTVEPFAGSRRWPVAWPTLLDPDRIDWTMRLYNPLGWSAVMMRGDAARRLDPFERDEYRFAEDFDLYHRIRAHGRIGRMADPLVRYRMHPGGASQTHAAAMLDAAARVLAGVYAPIFGEEAAAAAMLMSRYAAGGYAPADAATLHRCGVVIARLLAESAPVDTAYAEESSSALWWSIARTGLRAGVYDGFALARARPPFAKLRKALRPDIAASAAIGTVRQFRRRSPDAGGVG